jgi:hypothetical protein
VSNTSTPSLAHPDAFAHRSKRSSKFRGSPDPHIPSSLAMAPQLSHLVLALPLPLQLSQVVVDRPFLHCAVQHFDPVDSIRMAVKLRMK